MKKIMILNNKLNFITFLALFAGISMVLNCGCEKDSSEDEELKSGTVTDIDGNVYKTVKIGTQIWMAENLKTTRYRNGDAIPEVTDDDEWGDLTTGAYCNYDNNTDNVATYGRLYNWYAATDSRNLAPEGWHVATCYEWETLIDFLGGSDKAGGKLKEKGTTHWQSPNEGATDEFGFKAIPAGVRGSLLGFIFTGLGGGSDFWSTGDFYQNGLQQWTVGLSTNSKTIKLDYMINSINDGCSVRCVKDAQ